jgi:hypothetical protein
MPLGLMEHFDHEVGKRWETREQAAIVFRRALFRGHDRNDRAEMARPQAPEMEVGELIPVGFNGLAQPGGYMRIRIHVEQDRGGVLYQAVRPARDDAGADDAGQSIHSQPKVRASSRPMMTSTDTAASGATWMTAARILLSRVADPWTCSCSSKAKE